MHIPKRCKCFVAAGAVALDNYIGKKSENATCTRIEGEVSMYGVSVRL